MGETRASSTFPRAVSRAHRKPVSQRTDPENRQKVTPVFWWCPSENVHSTHLKTHSCVPSPRTLGPLLPPLHFPHPGHSLHPCAAPSAHRCNLPGRPWD